MINELFICNIYLKIKYTIPASPLSPPPYQGEGQRERFVTLIVYDVLGNEVSTLVNKDQDTRNYEIVFDASILKCGVYYFQLIAGNPSTGSGHGFVETRKMILLR